MADSGLVELGNDPGALPPGAKRPAEVRATRPGTVKIELEGPGGGFLERAGASIPTTTEGKVGFLEKLYGKGNVKTTSDGDILIPTPDGRALQPFDESTFSLRDVTADIVGPAIPVAGALATGSVNPFAVGAGAAGGAALRNVGAEILSGGTGQTIGERAGEVALEAALAAGGQALANTGALVFDALRPHNFVARQTKKLMAKPFAKKGEKLIEKTGIPLTPAEQTGSRAVAMVESFARRTPGGADTVFSFEQRRLRTALGKLQETMDTISPSAAAVGPLKVGDEIVATFDEALDSATALRRAQAAMDFSNLHRASNGVAVIPTRNTIGEIQKFVDELDVPGAGDATQRVVGQAKTMLKSLLTTKEGEATRLTGEQTQRLLQIYSNAQRGTGVVFRDMEKAQSRLIAGRIKDALLKDIDDAIAEAGDAGVVANALKLARDRYRLNSQAVNELADSTLARLIGNRTSSPEAIAERFLEMHPSEIASSMKIIESTRPEAGQAVRRLFIEQAIANAKPPISQQAAEGVRFSASRFVGSLPDMDVMKAAGFSRDEISQIGDISKALQRVADKAYEGSPTAFAGITWDAIRGAFTFSPVTTGRAVVALLAPRQIAHAMTTREGRQALLTLATTGPKTKQALAATTALAAIVGTEPGAEDVRPLEPLHDDTDQTLEDVLQ